MTSTLQCPFALEPHCLKGKVILIVGAVGGIGQAVAQEFAQRGGELILIDRHLKPLEKLYDTLTEQGLPEPALHVANLMTLGVDDARTIADHVQQLYGKLDSLVFCSGHWGTLTPIEFYPVKNWLEVMHLNVNMPFLLTKHLLPMLKATPNSTVVYSESPLSLSSKAYHGPFNASQAALRSLIEVLALEMGNHQPYVVGLNPQAVQTKSRANLYPGLPNSGYHPTHIAPFYTAMLMVAQEYHGQTYSLPVYEDTPNASIAATRELCKS